MNFTHPSCNFTSCFPMRLLLKSYHITPVATSTFCAEFYPKIYELILFLPGCKKRMLQMEQKNRVLIRNCTYEHSICPLARIVPLRSIKMRRYILQNERLESFCAQTNRFDRPLRYISAPLPNDHNRSPIYTFRIALYLKMRRDNWSIER